MMAALLIVCIALQCALFVVVLKRTAPPKIIMHRVVASKLVYDPRDDPEFKRDWCESARSEA